MINLQKNTLLREIPDNLLIDEKVVNLAKALQVSLSEMFSWAEKINYKMNLDSLDEAIIDHLLWESHITWNEGLALATTREKKINLIQSSIDIHRRKGTPYAIERVLQVVGLKGEVLEWFDYDADPYHFIVELQPSGKLSDLKDVRTLVSEFKNTRSWFDGFVIVVSDEFFLIFDQTHHYPVFFKECGEFGGEALFKHFESGTANVLDATYDYSVGYEVNEIQSSLYQKDIGLENETYQYKTIYPLCGELETINSTSHMVQSDSFIENESYFFGTQYPTCGEFYCEED